MSPRVIIESRSKPVKKGRGKDADSIQNKQQQVSVGHVLAKLYTTRVTQMVGSAAEGPTLRSFAGPRPNPAPESPVISSKKYRFLLLRIRTVKIASFQIKHRCGRHTSVNAVSCISVYPLNYGTINSRAFILLDF